MEISSITPVSFAAGVHSGAGRKSKKTAGTENTGQVQDRRSRENGRVSSAAAKAAMAAALAGIIYTGASSLMNNQGALEYVTSVPYSAFRSMSDVSRSFDMPEDIILDYNRYEDESEIAKDAVIRVPSEFDYLGDKIYQLKEKLDSNFIDSPRRFEDIRQLNAAKAKHMDQKDIAYVYCDDYNVYIKPHIKDNIHAYVENYGDKAGIRAKNFKKLFDIKDGALLEYNKYKMHTDIQDEYGVFDYDEALIEDGVTYVIPKDAINTDNINLDDYME